mmetsp:Transcript_11453/g.36459  ORF Transcript_11453/g.36459 Transcript_11453/m.36459 type:complete len:291 (+) Transcript_11453:51-923(+)
MARDEPSVRRDGKTTRVTLWRSALPSGRPVIPAAVEACLGGLPPARDPLTAAEAYRAHGSELWAVDDISGAVGRWERALEVLGEERGKVVPHVLDELEVVLRLNAAQGYLRLERFEPARGHALVVMQLRPLCAKALLCLQCLLRMLPRLMMLPPPALAGSSLWLSGCRPRSRRASASRKLVGASATGVQLRRHWRIWTPKLVTPLLRPKAAKTSAGVASPREMRTVPWQPACWVLACQRAMTLTLNRSARRRVLGLLSVGMAPRGRAKPALVDLASVRRLWIPACRARRL